MTWQQVSVIALALAASVALVAFGQSTLAGGLITAAVGALGLMVRSPLKSIEDRAPQADQSATAPHAEDKEPSEVN